ncbi:MAG TPA: alpha/beta fold hydrolase [Polyangiales bacterium]
MLWLVIGTTSLIAFAIGLTIWLLHLRLWRWLLSSSPSYESVETLVLPDGGAIELRRIAAPIQPSDPVPVLLIHGLAMNHRNHDAHEDYSFARHLHRAGRDVWLVTLRSGRRSPPIYCAANNHFAAMVKYDLPAAVAAVLARTRQRKLDLAVFSMGGMLLYAGLDRTLDARLVRRVVLFASPAKIRPLGPLGWLSFLPANVMPTPALRAAVGTFAFAPRLVPASLWSRVYNHRNVDRRVERGALCDVWENIPGRLATDFMRWSKAQGGEITVDGRPILGGLAKVNVPACFFAGTADWLAPEWTVREGYEAWGRDLPHIEKHFVVLGRAHGTRHDYGHCDIVYGQYAPSEVYAPAAQFLNHGVWPKQQSARVRTEDAQEAGLDLVPAPSAAE